MPKNKTAELIKVIEKSGIVKNLCRSHGWNEFVRLTQEQNGWKGRKEWTEVNTQRATRELARMLRVALEFLGLDNLTIPALNLLPKTDPKLFLMLERVYQINNDPARWVSCLDVSPGKLAAILSRITRITNEDLDPSPPPTHLGEMK